MYAWWMVDGARFLLQMEVTKVQKRRVRKNPVYRIRVGENSPNSVYLTMHTDGQI